MEAVERKIAGVDFSGAIDAGNRIWITVGKITEAGFVVSDCTSIRRISSAAVTPKTACRVLRNWIKNSPQTMVGLDFPFALPATVQGKNWKTFIVNFPRRFAGPQEFREFCIQKSAQKELKRYCEINAAVPFAAWNLRLYRQTFYGIRDILHPLMKEGAARIIPFQQPNEQKPQLLEACPASFLKMHRLYHSYKGNTFAANEKRDELLVEIRARFSIVIPAAIRRVIAENNSGDGLDSLIAALIVYQRQKLPWPYIDHPPDNFRQQGIVYF